MKLSIVIVSWNTKDILAQCLNSLAPVFERMNKDSRQTEVIVVDNKSSDGTIPLLKESFGWVTLIEPGENLGFPGGNNRGFAASQGDYILLLNPDTIIHEHVIEDLVDFLDQNQEAGAVGSMLLNEDGTLQESCYPRPTLSREIWRLFHMDRFIPFGIYDMDSWSITEPRVVDVLMGACILVRRPIIEEIGGMDEEYFMYSEEVDLCYRIQQKGWHIYYFPMSKITHLGGQSTKQVKTEMFLRLYESKLLYFSKNHGRIAAKTYKVILYFASLPRLLLFPLSKLQSSTPNQEKMLLLASQYQKLIQKLPSM